MAEDASKMDELTGLPVVSEPSVELAGEWLFRKGDDMKWKEPALPERGWQKVRLPASWEEHSKYTADNVYGWFRKTIVIGEEFRGKRLVLNLGKIDDCDETFFNGTIVGKSGSMPPRHETAYNEKREYGVPDGLIDYGKRNTIAVRVYDGTGGGGMYGDIGAAVGSAGPGRLVLGEEDMKWWREARFGMFIHWGLYALLGRGEWVMWNEQVDAEEYAKLKDQFKAENYDPNAWARLAKDAGMRYMVLTSRHHDGFSLWDSPASHGQFDAMHSAAKRDLVREYVDAVRKAGLRVGLYYSPLDWRFPGYFFPKMYHSSALDLKKQTYLQVRELLTKYGPLDILWYDGGGDSWLSHGGAVGAGKKYDGPPLWEPERLNRMVRTLAPKVIMTDRSGMELDFASEEGGEPGRTKTKRPWERCSTIAGAWGYQKGVAPRPFAEIIRELAVTVVRDGNLLLNVGPMPDGSIEPSQAARLREVGAWLGKYGESIYGTRGGPTEAGEWGGSTRKGDTVYLHIVKWPAGGDLAVPRVPGKVRSVKVLTPGTVKMEYGVASIKVIPDAAARGEVDTIIRLDCEPPIEAGDPLPGAR